jgi:exosome complex component RRP42
VIFFDATAQEESACPDKVHLFFTGSGKVCGIRTEGSDALDVSRIRPLLLVSPRQTIRIPLTVVI